MEIPLHHVGQHLQLLHSVQRRHVVLVELLLPVAVRLRPVILQQHVLARGTLQRQTHHVRVFVLPEHLVLLCLIVHIKIVFWRVSVLSDDTQSFDELRQDFEHRTHYAFLPNQLAVQQVGKPNDNP